MLPTLALWPVAVANFWDWITTSRSTAGRAERRVSEGRLTAELALAAPMPASRSRDRNRRPRRTCSQAPRAGRLGVAPTEQLVLLAFVVRPRRASRCRRCAMGGASSLPPWPPSSGRLAHSAGVDFDAPAASDAVVAKTGTGSSTAGHGRPLLCVARGFSGGLRPRPGERRRRGATRPRGTGSRRLAEEPGCRSAPPPTAGDEPVRSACDAIDELIS
jgi:hypothetical protein